MRMKSLFDVNKSYNYTSFEGKLGVWKLIGVEAGTSLGNTLDTFTNGKGDYLTFKRDYVIEQYESGNIKPIINTEVIIKQDAKKKTGRAI